MASVKGHPILRDVIDLTCHNIETENYGDNSLDITGPDTLGKSFRSVTGEDIEYRDYPNGVRLLLHRSTPPCMAGIISANGRTLFHTKYPTYRKDCKWYNQSENYAKLWHEGRVFAIDEW